MFSSQFFIENRLRVMQESDADVIVLPANGLLQRSADITFPFRQDSNFWYVTGCDIADAVVVLDCKKQTSFLILPYRLKHRDLWEGELDTASLSAASGIAAIYPYKKGWEVLVATIAKAHTVGSVLPPRSYEPNYGMYINPAKLKFARKLKSIANKKLIDVRRVFAKRRSVKSPEEINAIKKAVQITEQSLKHLQQQMNTMNTEKDIEIFLSHAFQKNGASGHAYDPIIASGKNATTIHYEHNNATLQKNQLILLDVGASYNYYAADVSRTWAYATPTKRQADVYAAVKEVHSFALNALRPGVVLRDYEAAVRTCMNEHLEQLGLMKRTNTKLSTVYYPHLTSHFLGLDVHDSGLYDSPLEAGMVITVEPGIYIPEESIGVRIEDDVVVTAGGVDNLSKNIPYNLLY